MVCLLQKRLIKWLVNSLQPNKSSNNLFFIKKKTDALPTLLPVYCKLNRANLRQVCGVAANTVLNCPRFT